MQVYAAFNSIEQIRQVGCEQACREGLDPFNSIEQIPD